MTEALASQSTALTVQLSLLVSGRATLDTLTYHFLVTVIVETAHPMVGPVAGGTTVVIDGHVRAALVSPTRIRLTACACACMSRVSLAALLCQQFL